MLFKSVKGDKYMKNNVKSKLAKIISCFLIVILIITMSIALQVQVQAATAVTITVDGSSYTQITRSKDVGVNIEMSLTSDEMWSTNGKWMEETFKASDINIMRWGYDAWAFDWQNEVPLSPNKYWGALNSKDAAGTFGFYEFIDFCVAHNVIPFVMIPIESLNTTDVPGTATLQKVKDLTSAMASYMNSHGITNAYFDMGNEPWNTHTKIKASYYGGLCKEFQPLIKSVNSNYKLVLQRAPENILWSSWNRSAESAGAGYFDAYDDHRYAFYDWNAYFNKNDDNFFTAGPSIAGAEPLLGECNIGWTPQSDNWQVGHTRDLGGGMALLNAMLDTINDNAYSKILTWPSHWPSKASVSGATDRSFGWFNLDSWYNNKQTERLTGPMLAHMIINQNVLDRKLNTTSSQQKVRTFAYTDNQNSVLKLIVINKWDPYDLTINIPAGIPAGYTHVSASVMKGTSVWDTTPTYTSHIAGNVALTGTSFVNSIPAESVVVYTFFKDASSTVPGSFQLATPSSSQTGVSTAKTFEWTAAANANNYRLIVSENSNLSSPVIDVYTGNCTKYQPMKDLAYNKTYYWKVIAVNKNGSTDGTNSGISFTTASRPVQTIRTWNDDSVYMSHGSNWNDQSSSGCYNDDDHSSKTANGYMEFSFTGTRAKIYGVMGSWCGKADVQINYGAKNTIDTYSATTIPQSVIYDTGVMPYGTYKITLTVRGDKNTASSDSWIEFDKAEVINEVDQIPPDETVTWNNDNPNISSYSTWNNQAYTGCYRNDDSSSNTYLASKTFNFTGTQGIIYGIKGSWCGKADITVDGVSKGTIDTYSATTQYQTVLYDTGVLPYGNHTVKITVKATKSSASSGKWIEFDKFEWK